MMLLGAAVGGVLIAARVEPAFALGIGMTIAFPIVGLMVIVGVLAVAAVSRIRRSSDRIESEARVLTALATAVGSGATVRQALTDTQSARVSADVRRRCAAGRPMAEIVEDILPGFPVTARELGIVLDQSERVGSRVADALHELARGATDEEQRGRDLRVAVAQSRFSAIVVGVVPLVIAVLIVAVRGVPEPGGPVILVPMAAGAVMMMLGSAAVFALSRRVPT